MDLKLGLKMKSDGVKWGWDSAGKHVTLFEIRETEPGRPRAERMQDLFSFSSSAGHVKHCYENLIKLFFSEIYAAPWSTKFV